MDRLEEIKTKMKVERPEYFNSVSLMDAHWLVTEIERLRKEEEWLIFTLAKRMLWTNKYRGKCTAIANHKVTIEREMQQALKGE